MGLGMRLDVFEHLVHVVAGREIRADAAQDDEADFLGLARDRVDVHVQRFKYFLGQGIQLLRTVQPQSRQTAVIFPTDQIIHGVSPLRFHHPPPSD
jgi:hypothetical protein